MLAGMFSGKLFSTTEDAQLPVGGTGTRCCHQPGLQQPLGVSSPLTPAGFASPFGGWLAWFGSSLQPRSGLRASQLPQILVISREKLIPGVAQSSGMQRNSPAQPDPALLVPVNPWISQSVCTALLCVLTRLEGPTLFPSVDSQSFQEFPLPMP